MKGKEKTEKGAEKLPALFRKEYAEKKFEKKLLARLFVPADREFVRSLFTASADRKTLAIPKDAQISREDRLRLKRLAKQVGSQKLRVRVLPFAAVAALIATAVIVVGVFKNPLAKRLIKAGVESAAGARCDIGSVSVKFLDASLTVDSLAVANKNDTMKNLFQLDRIVIDFDLKQLLRGRFVVDSLEAAGIEPGTQRTTDGALPARKKSAEDSKPNPVVEKIQAFALGAQARAAESVTDIFAAYNPQTLLQGLLNRLQSPAVAEDARAQIEALIPAWKNTPAELASSVNSVIKRGESFTRLDVNALKSDPVKLVQTIRDATSLINDVKAVQQQAETLVTRIDTDAKAALALTTRVRNALDSDMKLVNGEISKIASFSIADGKNFLTDMFDTVIADALGKYYPYARRGFELARDYLTSDERRQKKAEQEAEKAALRARRLPGRIVEYRADTIPRVLIKKMHGSGRSGAFSLDALVTDISSDMEKWGKPVSLQTASSHGGMAESLLAQLDVRENRPNPLLTANVSVSGFALDMRLPNAESVQGAPQLAGTASAAANCRFDTEELFSIDSSVNINPAVISAAAFEPEFAYKIYSNVLSGIKTVNAGVLAAYTQGGGFTLKITSNLDAVIKTALLKEVNAQLTALKNDAIARARAELDKVTGGVFSQFDEFLGIQSLIKGEGLRLGDFRKTLESRLSELQSSSAPQVENKAKDAAEDALKKLLPGLPKL
jgi:uncharacterized protein (TIGR03545 family)